MAIEDLSPAEASGGTEELRALLVGYASVLDTIDGAPPMLWAGLERPRILRWLRFPAPRALVNTLLVRHVSRSISTLKRSGSRRVALSDDAQGPLRDLKMLEQFDQSLPTGVRMAAIAPMALLGILFVAYIIARYVLRADFANLLGNLGTAVFGLNREGVIDAFKKDHEQAELYFGIAITVTWSLTLVIALLLLPAFAVKRRLLSPLAGLEARGFAALGCRRVEDLELDLVTQLLVITPVVIAGALILWLGAVMIWAAYHPHAKGFVALVGPGPDPAVGAVVVVLAALTICLAGLAGTELRVRYGMRRTNATRRHARITRISLWLVWLLALALFIDLVSAKR
jgi:hypothetical protein